MSPRWRAFRWLCACAILVAATGCLRINVQGDPARALERLDGMLRDGMIRRAIPLRVATYNTSLYSD